MGLTNNKTTNIVYIDTIVHHVTDIIINDNININNSSRIANNIVSINDTIVDNKTNSNRVKVAMTKDDVSTSTQGLFNNSCPYMYIYIYIYHIIHITWFCYMIHYDSIYNQYQRYAYYY